tara:strand:- start:550 stop:963 length:414 start_codon:yes stop_codon:yes gene_type:complete
MSDCPLCYDKVEVSRVVYSTPNVYSMIPISPLMNGHAMVLPKDHKKIEDLSPIETMEIHDMLIILKDRLVSLDSDKHPMIVTLTDTDHSSIRDHFHYHIIPSKGNIRELMAAYDKDIPENKKLDSSELEKMAVLLRP